MFYIKEIATNKVLRHAGTFQEAVSLQKYLKSKGRSTIITKNNRVIIDYESRLNN